MVGIVEVGTRVYFVFKLCLQSFFLAVVYFLSWPEHRCRCVCLGSYSKLDT